MSWALGFETRTLYAPTVQQLGYQHSLVSTCSNRQVTRIRGKITNWRIKNALIFKQIFQLLTIRNNYMELGGRNDNFASGIVCQIAGNCCMQFHIMQKIAHIHSWFNMFFTYDCRRILQPFKILWYCECQAWQAVALIYTKQFVP